jgi:hypothetical protein
VGIPIRYMKGGGERSDLLDKVFAELAYARFLKPRPDVASSECDSYTEPSSTRRSSAPYLQRQSHR